MKPRERKFSIGDIIRNKDYSSVYDTLFMILAYTTRYNSPHYLCLALKEDIGGPVGRKVELGQWAADNSYQRVA